MRRIDARSGWLIALTRFSVALRRCVFVDMSVFLIGGLITGEGLIVAGLLDSVFINPRDLLE
jgi:hypothetical protein